MVQDGQQRDCERSGASQDVGGDGRRSLERRGLAAQNQVGQLEGEKRRRGHLGNGS